MKVYKSKESKNTAYISEVMMHPYYGAPVQRGYQLAIYDSQLSCVVSRNAKRCSLVSSESLWWWVRIR